MTLETWPASFRDFHAAIVRMATLATGGRIDRPTVDAEIARLRATWSRTSSGDHDDLLRSLLGAEQLAEVDLFDRAQLAEVVAFVKNENVGPAALGSDQWLNQVRAALAYGAPPVPIPEAEGEEEQAAAAAAAEPAEPAEPAALLRLSQCREERTGVRIAPEAAGSSGQHRAQLVLLLLLLQ